ncbi:MAG: hypothetical protein NTX09_05970, partial [Verrucomicrobia bacterium]|nr:hypothetical protein [Verrucomicrobiota bacterium]
MSRLSRGGLRLVSRYVWSAHENLWCSLREWRSLRGEGGSETLPYAGKKSLIVAQTKSIWAAVW